MKLKMYLRGAGLAMVLTALMTGISHGNQSKVLSDEEIVARAEALGMTKIVSETGTLDDKVAGESEDIVDTHSSGSLLDESEDSIEDVLDDVNADEEIEENDVDESVKPWETPKPETSSEPEIEIEEEIKEEIEPEVFIEPEVEEDMPEIDETILGETKTIQIVGGNSSEVVSKKLLDVGLIEDKDAYNAYLIKNGYSTRICVGTFHIAIGSSYEQIAKIITKS